MTNGDVGDMLSDLHDHLAATATRPVRADASRWLGEAEAVARDLAVGPMPSEDVLRTRLGHIEQLLSNVERTEDAAADEHVVAADAALTDAINALTERN